MPDKVAFGFGTEKPDQQQIILSAIVSPIYPSTPTSKKKRIETKRTSTMRTR
jgi:hypothetical protein